MTDVKIIIGGDRGTGKTRIFRSIFSMPLSDVSAYYPTFEPNISRITLNDLVLEVWDLPGTLSHDLDHKHSFNIDFNNLAGAILLFDLTRIQTYESINKWVERVWTDSPGAPIIIVANKLDLAPTSHDAKKMLRFINNFVDKINKNTSFYCKLMEVALTKEKNAFRVFNELLGAIYNLRGKDVKMISELEAKIMPKKELIIPEAYKTPIFAEEDKILSDISPLLANTRANPNPATIQKLTYFLKNSRTIRKTFMHLKQFYADELINDAQTNPNWLVEENFLYLVMWEYFHQLLNQKLPEQELGLWCKQFADIFIGEKDSFDRFLDLNPKTAVELLLKFKNNFEIVQTDQFGMEIYVAYRDEVYES